MIYFVTFWTAFFKIRQLPTEYYFIFLSTYNFRTLDTLNTLGTLNTLEHFKYFS